MDDANRQIHESQPLNPDMLNYIEVMKKHQQFETSIRQLMVKKEQYQNTLKRAKTLGNKLKKYCNCEFQCYQLL